MSSWPSTDRSWRMKSTIDGVVFRRLTRHQDRRGWLAELYRRDELPDDGLPVMAYVSLTHPGVTRGPHEHREQTDLLCFVGDAPFRLYLWDGRVGASSPDRPEMHDLPLGECWQVTIPPGVVHAYRNVGDRPGLIFNAADRLYGGGGRGESVDEIRHEEDPRSPYQVPE